MIAGKRSKVMRILRTDGLITLPVWRISKGLCHFSELVSQSVVVLLWHRDTAIKQRRKIAAVIVWRQAEITKVNYLVTLMCSVGNKANLIYRRSIRMQVIKNYALVAGLINRPRLGMFCPVLISAMLNDWWLQYNYEHGSCPGFAYSIKSIGQ